MLITFSLPLHLYETRAERNSTPSRSFSVHLLILLRLLVEVILILRGRIEEPSTHLCPSLSTDCPGPSGLSVFSKLVPVSKSLGRERAKVVALPQTRCTPPPIAQLLPGRASYYSSSHIHPPLPSSTTYHQHHLRLIINLLADGLSLPFSNSFPRANIPAFWGPEPQTRSLSSSSIPALYDRRTAAILNDCLRLFRNNRGWFSRLHILSSNRLLSAIRIN